jgi:hypothetical protein
VDLPEEKKALINGTMTLVKVKVQRADYYQTRSLQHSSWWQSALHSVVAWFRHNTYRSDSNTFYPAS